MQPVCRVAAFRLLLVPHYMKVTGIGVFGVNVADTFDVRLSQS